ncbi:MAG: hypothetical protein JWN30_1588 [Bacilli bacterium]|nr:hypothetical protein [Bacilli bacterium]
MSEDHGISTIQFKVDQQLQLEGARSISEIEDVSIATEITSFDRQSDTYFLEGAILFSGFIRETLDQTPGQWSQPVSDVFGAEPGAAGHNGVHPLYYRLPFELHVPIAAQEGPFFNVTARVGAWNLAVNAEDQVHAKADLIIQGLSGAGGYEFLVGSQQETRDALGALVNPADSLPVDSPFVTYEHREWVLEGHPTDPQEEVIFIRDLIAQNRSEEQDVPEIEAQSEQSSAVLDSAKQVEEELVEMRHEEEFAELSAEPLSLRPLQADPFQDLFSFADINKLTPPFVTELQVPQFGQGQETAENMNQAGEFPSAVPWASNYFQPVVPAEPAGEAETVADPTRPQWDEVLPWSQEWPATLAQEEPVSEPTGGLYDTEAAIWQPRETYQFAFPDASLQQIGAEEPTEQVLNKESSPTYSIHPALQQESSALSFSGFASGHPFREENQEAAVEQLDAKDRNAQDECVVDNPAAEETSEVTTESLWSSFRDKTEGSYTLVFRIAQDNETIEEISDKFSVSVADLMRENQLTRDESYTGKLLYIPTNFKK